MDVTSASNPPNNFPGLDSIAKSNVQKFSVVGPSGKFNAIPVGFEQLTGLSEAKHLTVPEGAMFAVIQPETQDVRWRDDGSAPTASVGMRLPVSEGELYYDGDLSEIQFIEVTASAKINITYFA